MLKVLLKSKLLSIGAWFTGANRRRKQTSKGSAIAFAALMIYAFGAISFMFFGMFGNLAAAFSQTGLGWLYFALMFVLSFGLMFIGSVFTAKSQLFESRDNDLLLALPVKSSDILLSRLFLLAAIDLLMGLVVAVPACIAWGSAAAFSPAGLISLITGFILVLLLAMAISALFGWILSLVTARLPKNRSLFTVLFSLIFMGLYMYLVGNMNQMILQLAENPEPAKQALGAIAPVVWLGRAAAEGNLRLLALSIPLPAALFAAAYVLLSRTFIRTVTTKAGGRKEVYRGNKASQHTPRQALLQREWNRFISCPTYVMNGIFGNILAIIGAAAALLRMKALTDVVQRPGMELLLPAVFLFAGSALGAMTLVTAPSVSIEGKNLWIGRSLPVPTRDLLQAKLKLHCLLGMPSLLPFSLVGIVLLRPAFSEAVLMILLPLAMVAFSATVGLWAGIRHPNLDWTTEAQAVKSGMDVLITMGITMGSMVPPLLVYFLFAGQLSLTVVAGGFLLLILLFTLVLYRWIMGKGKRLYEEL